MRSTLLFLTVAVIVALVSCKENVAPSMEQIQQVKDSVFKSYPTVASIYIHVEETSDLTITLGDVHLYAAAADKKQKTANEMAQIALYFFGKDNNIKRGKLIVTKNQQNEVETPPDAIITEINIDSLKKLTVR